MERWKESNAFDGLDWIGLDPKDMWEKGHHSSKVVGHMWTSMLECIAWEVGEDFACVR